MLFSFESRPLVAMPALQAITQPYAGHYYHHHSLLHDDSDTCMTFPHDARSTSPSTIIGGLDPFIDLADADADADAAAFVECCQCQTMINTTLSSRCVDCQHDKCDDCKTVPPPL